MNILQNEKKCVGCGACVDCCPVNALKLEHDENGFYQPVIDKEKCINCSKCVKICPAINVKIQEGTQKTDYFYGWSKDEEIRKVSSSGGAFSVLANKILQQNGVVFGANYSDDFKSVIMDSTENCDLDSLRRSKYCQSKANGLYSKIKTCLEQGKKVMLTGTPCQIAGARNLFGENDNLLLVDFVCGGVTPDTHFSNYIEWLENKNKSKVTSVNFRDKKHGWDKMYIKVTFENGKTYYKHFQMDYYYYYFYNGVKNESCLSCSFVKHQDADITISDFWGFKQNNLPNDNKGMSLICARTKLGKQFFEGVKDDFVLYDLQESQVKYAFKEKKHSQKYLDYRENLLKQLQQKTFVEVAKENNFKGGDFVVFIKRIINKVRRK